MTFFFQKIFRKLNESFLKFEIPNPVIGGCYSSLRGCESYFQLLLIKFLQVLRNDVFYGFFKKKILENVNLKVSKNLKFLLL